MTSDPSQPALRRIPALPPSGAGQRRGAVLIVAGRGRYEDRWHDHAATSHRVAQVLAGAGLTTTVRSTFPDAFVDLQDFGLVVVNAGSGRVDPDFDGDDDDWAPAHAALTRYAREGGAVLALHQSANTFVDSPDFTHIVGGRWVPGTSHHPPRVEARFDPQPGHPITAGLGSITALDEQYCDLVIDPGSQVLLTTTHAGTAHPVAWVGGAGGVGGVGGAGEAGTPGWRSVYDGMGHDLQAFESVGRCRLLAREAWWLLGAPDEDLAQL